MTFFLGVDVGGTKTHTLVSDETGQVLGFASGGPGNWEGIGYEGLTQVLKEVTLQALDRSAVSFAQISGAGLGIGGFDWPSQRQDHVDAIRRIGLTCPLEIVNDATLGILAGAREGWGISVVSGTGCNCRGWSRDYKQEGRVVGGAANWSGEAAGASDIVERAMQAVTFEWDQRGPSTALTPDFIQLVGAKDIHDLVEGLYTDRYDLSVITARHVFQVAARGDLPALGVVRWAGDQLGQMAVGVIHQLRLEQEDFDVVLIGSLFEGHPLMAETMAATIHAVAPSARLVRLSVPPVVGGVILGMQAAGLDALPLRPGLIKSTRLLLASLKG